MHYKPKSIDALHIALGGLPGHMQIEVEPGIAVSAKTVGELRKVTSWPENLIITTPQEHYPESISCFNCEAAAANVCGLPMSQRGIW